jgi:hypothetical protein
VITIACVKVGQKYDASYVNKLESMVERHTTRVYRFICLTDDHEGLKCTWSPIGTRLPGWWAKLVLFEPHVQLEGQRVLYLDLDTIIVGNIDFLLDYVGSFAILRDFYRPLGWGSAIMAFQAGFGQHIWEHFRTNPQRQMFSYHGDQEYLQTEINSADLWQDLYPDKIVSYKVHCKDKGLPLGASVVCFHGVPRPHEVDDLWVQEEWW